MRSRWREEDRRVYRLASNNERPPPGLRDSVVCRTETTARHLKPLTRGLEQNVLVLERANELRDVLHHED